MEVKKAADKSVVMSVSSNVVGALSSNGRGVLLQ
jgi:hypothetical protein